MDWQRLLQQVLDLMERAPAAQGMEWAVVGSVASALQGCRVRPNDLDLLAAEPAGVYRFAAVMAGHTPPTCAVSPDASGWYSSQALPIRVGPSAYGFVWHFGRWFVDGTTVEMAHIALPDDFRLSAQGGGIWEAGLEIWPHVRRVPFAGYWVPVVPLEIQLGTSISRNLADRAEEMTAVLKEGSPDLELLHRSLTAEQLEAVRERWALPADLR